MINGQYKEQSVPYQKLLCPAIEVPLFLKQTSLIISLPRLSVQRAWMKLVQVDEGIHVSLPQLRQIN